ncbi:site-specific DNA-methyltransferase [Vibrio vulnificus]|uniref:site-specific DNA-methyltransferase n=1 Tax=Vibrio vulnificus TaxID=672 RepID=UPI001022BDB3|nr:site-specific DNA-methyltransferase [Vibrio vulnificus]EKG2502702.1 site-specific DNA-methyltransferase [Vibrio vulnificus]MCU8553483.1 site-specific DNA-methyltransferase [Vibrio vulnificus]RZQ38200.1 site-specific DNA-methyltransferase [Vibrio vulnificus]HAS8091689.1 site-specific DNA-methyltransferase [Vibrio vulnificus]HAS8586412.1 site-specific DNA-methyltransferase [Vibrio vulnificus]
MNIATKDTTLINKIKAYSLTDDTYWSFKGRSTRQHFHALIQYPAMMVPEMQGELIDAIQSVDQNIKTVFDPFVGSGTTLGESMIRGLDFVGHDINPLAILACEVKSGPLFTSKLKEKIERLLNTIKDSNPTEVALSFKGIDKWFLPEVQLELSAIYLAIKSEPSKWARKIFWLALSNTVRSTCNSRSSTYKLHIKSEEQIEKIGSPKQIFEKNILKSFENIQSQKSLLIEKGHFVRSKSVSKVKIRNVDAKTRKASKKKYDLLISSPPYGDNATTVTYGQFSYLPLQWIDLKDINESIDESLLDMQNKIDSSSLGGSLKESTEKLSLLGDRSSSLLSCVNQIDKINSDNTKKLISFIYDLDLSLRNAVNELRENAYMIWTLGNRRISNIEVPLDKIMRELLESLECKFVYQLERDIPSKRMASRNKVASTMGKETVLIMRR